MKTAITVAVTLVIVAASFAAVHGQPPRSVWDGAYTEAQAVRGAALFDRHCAQCHGAGAAGGEMAPSLVDAAFLANYDGLTVGDLFDRNRRTMPVGREAQLSGQEYADITAFILQADKFPGGAIELAAQSAALKQIAFVAQQPQNDKR